MSSLKLFTDPNIFPKLDRPIVTQFLERLQHCLPPQAAALLTAGLDYEQYCAAWPAQFSSLDGFGQPLLQALFDIETLAMPENQSLLDNALGHLPPGFDIKPYWHPLHQSLYLWLIAQGDYGFTFPIPSTLSPSTLSPNSPQPSSSSTLDVGSSALDVPSSSSPSPHTDTPQSALPTPHSEVFARLAKLNPIEYDLARRAEAKRLGIRLVTLDDAVDLVLAREDDAQANQVILPHLGPWPEPITDAPALFDQVQQRFLLYLYLPGGAAVVFTLWVPHAHAINAFTHTPRLNLTSIEPGCGKTTALDLLASMTPKPLRTDNLKIAVLYRVVHRHQPTLHLDELDSYLHLYPELRGLLNAGDRSGGCALRCEGHVPRSFKAFAATALAGIGHLAPTLRDRSIIIPLVKAPPGSLQGRLDPRHLETETILGRKIARWAQDNFAAIAACDPTMPSYNRPADKWRPLFALAQVIGGHWPQRILDAFHALNSKQNSNSPPSSTPHSEPINHQLSTINSAPSQSKIETPSPIPQSALLTPHSQALLSDLRTIFAQSGAQRLFSSSLVQSLRAIPDRPWSGTNNGDQPITEVLLARHLSPFGIRPKLLRIAPRRGKGYDLADLTPAFNKFLPPATSEP